MPIASINNSRYFLLCKDEFSTYTHVYFQKSKGETDIALAKLICEFEVDTKNGILRIQSDKGTEFNNAKVETLSAIEHIVHETTAVRAPQQNGLIEREVQNIGNMARTSLLASDLPPELWEHAIETACYLRNRLPNSRVPNTPYEMIFSRKPVLSHLCNFGQQVHVIVNGHYLTRFESRTEPGHVVGFTRRRNTYRVYLLNSGRVIDTQVACC